MAVFLVLALWSFFCAGGALGGSASGRIEAFAGETVVLPCRINASDEVPTVEWSKKGQKPIIAFLYRHGCETYDMKDQVFWYRTNLFMDKLNSGNISLMISNVQPSDTGTYVCTVRSRTSQEVATWELVVAVDGGVTLQCEAGCWFPEPMIDFLDIEENHISAEDQKTHQVSEGCFTVSRRLTLQTHTERITCRVQHPKMSQVKDTDIHIPGNLILFQ
ncbi:butyrophilin subfamily 1 member A1-like [Chaetodon trifascialis]|uniref:butyrophilin subfamily 1 member A1-like n=1 Tax=Chaetodon trifascialis TaxID=109706 RepID=UPI003996B1ED